MIAPTDTRWRPDQRALENGEMQLAASEKNRLEEKQRAVRKYNEKHKIDHKPAYFKEWANPNDNNQIYYVYNNLYWEQDWITVKNYSEFKLEEGKVVVKVDPKYYRPTEVDLLIGDPTKAMAILSWVPKYDLAALVKEMVANDITLFKKELHIKQSGLQFGAIS